MATKDDKSKKALLAKKIKIAWSMPDDIRAVFANHMLITHQGGQFVLNFAEAVLPPLVGEEGLKEMPDEVEARIFLRIAVPTDVVPGIISALQKNYDGYLQECEASISGGKASPDE